LEVFSGCLVAAAEEKLLILAIRCDDMHDEAAAGVEMPDFVGAQAVEGGELIAGEQEVNCGGSGAVAMVAGER
jgi:hypothetical protein